MKKVLSILLALTLLMGVSSGFVFAEDLLPDAQDYEVECLAAPAVAGLILEDAGIDNRWGQGKNGGNYIKEVAQLMSNEAIFPAYEWDGTWDGETYVDKCDVDAYYRAVYNYLAMRCGVLFMGGLSVAVVNHPVDTNCGEIIKSEGDTFPTAQVFDQFGYPAKGVGVRISLQPAIADFLDVVETDSSGIAVFDNISYPKLGYYRLRFYLADSTLRNENTKPLTDWFNNGFMIGSWDWVEMANRVMVIDTHEDGVFSGKLTSDTGTIFGNINGTIYGDGIEFYYDRIGYATDGYFLDFDGEFTGCNSFNGTWIHGNNGIPRTGEYTGTFIR